MTVAQKRGILFIMLMSFLNISINALVRKMGGDFHPLQLVFLYNVCALLVALPIFLKAGVRLPSKRLGVLFGVRSVLELVGFTLLFFSLRQVPFPATTVLMLCGPIIGVTIAVVFLGEKASRYTWMALATGFVGVLAVARPGADDFTIWSLVLVAAVACFAINMNLIRRMAHHGASAVEIVFYMVLFTMLLAAIPASQVWLMPTVEHLPFLLMLAVVVASAQFCVALSLKNTDIVTVSPFMFFHVIWGAGYGVLLFNEVISDWTILGGGIIFLGVIAGSLHGRKKAA